MCLRLHIWKLVHPSSRDACFPRHTGYGSADNLTACAAREAELSDDFGSGVVCSEGSFGRLCDMCDDAYFYALGEGCLPCSGSGSLTGSVVMFLVLLSIAVAVGLLIKLSDMCITDDQGDPMNITDTAIWKVVTNPARFKIMWATAQIIGTITWATGVIWPEPFATMSSILSISQLNLAEVV